MRGRRVQIRVTPTQRAAVVVVALILMVPAFVTLIQGRLHYRDDWGLLVFAPYTLLIGLVMIVFAILAPKHK